MLDMIGKGFFVFYIHSPISKALLDLWAFEICICNLRQIYDIQRHNLKKTYSALFVELLFLATLRFCHFQQQKTFHNYVY